MKVEALEAAILRYALEGQPYGKRQALNPIDEPTDLEQLVTESLLDVDARITAPLEQAFAADKPCFFLISGRSKTGRSTVANLILEKHRELQGLERERFVVPDAGGSRDAGGHDPFQVYRDWIGVWLYFSLDRKEVDLPEAVVTEIDKVLDAASKASYLRRYARLLKEIHLALHKAEPKAGFGVCIENVRAVDHVRCAFQLFQLIPIAVVFTAQDYDGAGGDVVKTMSDPNKEFAARIHHISLEPLTDEAVEKVADRRWNGPQPHPFEPGAFQGAFSESPTFGLALHFLTRLLAVRAVSAPGKELWPQAQSLRYTSEQVRQTLPLLKRKDFE